MLGVFLLSWVVFPAVMLVLCLGAGLAARQVAGPQAFPPLLLVPVGLAVLVVLSGLLCYFAVLAPLAGPACAVVGVVGVALGWRSLRPAGAAWLRKINPWATGAAVGAWAVVAAPVVLSGKPGFTGYAHIVDISYQFDLAAHFAHTGRSIPTTATSAYQTVLHKYLASGYPGGGQWTLGALSNLMPVDLSWLYQPFMAFLAAATALSLYSLLGRLIDSTAWRALGAFVAAQPNILLAYGLAGGIKELSTACFLVLSAALIAEVLPRPKPGRSLAVVPVGVAATVASLSLTTLPWVGILGVGVGMTTVVVQRRLSTLVAWAQMGALAAVLSLPTLAASLKLLPTVKGTGPVDLGNLAAPVPAISAAGVWITADYRFPAYAHQGPSEALAILVLVLGAVGLIFAIRRKAWSVAWLGVAGVVSLYYVAHRYGPWIQFKADCLTAPIALLLAFVGVGALMRSKRRFPIGAIAGLAIAVGVLAGNALLYRNVTLAPYARLHNLEAIGERFAGQGPTLTPDFEEYAEYYLRDDDQTSMVNGPTLGLRPTVNRATEPGGIFAYDLNEYTLSWLESFRTITMRRSPYASRPPSNYRLVYLSTYYAVWQRDRPATLVYAHFPMPAAPSGHDAAVCREVSVSARHAGPSAQVAYMPAPSGFVQVGASNMTLRGALQGAGGVMLANGSGRAERDQPIPTAGHFDFYLSGSFGRPVNVSVDGQHVGTAAYQVSYPGEWLLIASRRLSAGVHHIEISVGGASLHPGNGPGVDGFNRTIGPLVITPAQPAEPVVHYASVRDFTRLCRAQHQFRWVEVVRSA
jgi:hypothetical protein